MPRELRKQRLNLFLIKKDVTSDNVIRVDRQAQLQSFAISDEFDFSGTLYVETPLSKSASWLSFLRSATTEPLPNVRTQSPGALAVLEVGDRIFCAAWGTGRYCIDDGAIERRFGMIVTLNTVDPQKIRAVDREEFEAVTRTTRSHLSVSSTLDNFGIDVQRDLVRSVTGTPEDEGFAAHVTGADNLIINCGISFAELGSKCREALAHYTEEDYKSRGFGWIDNFLRVRDPARVAALEVRLVNAIRISEVDNIFLSPPTLVENQELRGFKYPGEGRLSDPHPDLRINDFLESQDRDSITLDWLKKRRIREFNNDSDRASRDFPVFDAIVYEAMDANKLYVLSRGEWFEVDQDYVQEVSEQLAEIKDDDQLQLPTANRRESEGQYNARAAETSNGLIALMDTRAARVQYGGGRSIIEVCDLLTLEKGFVHVKVGTKSSNLSHLFAQGTNAAQAFRDKRFRHAAAQRCPVSHRHILAADEVRNNEFAVTFAIITHHVGDVKGALPFLSKQSLVNAARILRNAGYRVYTKRIPIA